METVSARGKMAAHHGVLIRFEYDHVCDWDVMGAAQEGDRKETKED
jgi:hypothetical protein